MPVRRWFFPRYYVFRDEQGQELGRAGSLWALLNLSTAAHGASGHAS